MGPKAGLIFPFPGEINRVKKEREKEREGEGEGITDISSCLTSYLLILNNSHK